MDEKYQLLPNVAVRGKVLIRRMSDGKVARCKLSYIELPEGSTDGVYYAKSNTKADRLDGLTWTTEV